MVISQPVSQKRLTNIAIVKLKTHGFRFEIACYKNKVVNWREGLEKNVDEVLQSMVVFTNVSQGVRAKEKDLKKAFGDNMTEEQICVRILEKGELQVSEKERTMHLEALSKEIMTIVAKRCVHPQTGRVLTLGNVESALKQVNFVARPNVPAKKQALKAIDAICKALPEYVTKAKMRFCMSCDVDRREEIRAKILAVCGAEGGVVFERESVVEKPVYGNKDLNAAVVEDVNSKSMKVGDDENGVKEEENHALKEVAASSESGEQVFVEDAGNSTSAKQTSDKHVIVMGSSEDIENIEESEDDDPFAEEEENKITPPLSNDQRTQSAVSVADSVTTVGQSSASSVAFVIVGTKQCAEMEFVADPSFFRPLDQMENCELRVVAAQVVREGNANLTEELLRRDHMLTHDSALATASTSSAPPFPQLQPTTSFQTAASDSYATPASSNLVSPQKTPGSSSGGEDGAGMTGGANKPAVTASSGNKCTTCGPYHEENYRVHVKGDWHVFNTKRKVKKLAVMSYDDWREYSLDADFAMNDFKAVD